MGGDHWAAAGLNGLGYLNFEARDFDEAFSNFNRSAIRGSADGMFNLASLYLTGSRKYLVILLYIPSLQVQAQFRVFLPLLCGMPKHLNVVIHRQPMPLLSCISMVLVGLGNILCKV